MPVNAISALKVTDEAGAVRFFPLAPQKGARPFTVQTKPWEPGDPTTPWRIPLHPWIGGVNVDRLGNLGSASPSGRHSTHSKANADTSNAGMLLFPPLVNSITLTNGNAPSKIVQFASKLFVLGGRYMYSIDPTNNTAALDMDFGAGNAAVDFAPFNSELIVAMGETTKIWKRQSTASNATSGTADAAVTTGNTTLTDTRLALQVNAWIGGVVTCNGKTMTVTSNTATVFTGASWSGGSNPGNGNAWSATGFWTQATDATYAIALGVVDYRLWRAETTNRLSNCSGTPLTLANWTPASPNQYYAGDATWPVVTIVDFGGIPWVGTGIGMFAPDPQSRFKNQTPQLRNAPDSSNCVGAFVAQGALWVPSPSGLFRVIPGQSKKRGPETTNRPGYRFHVRGGVEYGDFIYLLVTDDAAVGYTAIYKMARDYEGYSGRDYRFYEWAQLDGTTATGRCIAVTTVGTNPELFAPYGNNMRWIALGRGGGRDIDDPNYNFGLAMSLETGVMLPGPDMAVLSTLTGVDTVLDYSRAGESLTVAYAMDRLKDSDSFTSLLTTAEGGGTAPIATTTNYQKVTRYAAANVAGQFLEVQFTGTLTSAAGTTRPVIREAWAFGYSHPATTDVVELVIIAENTAMVNGLRTGIGRVECGRLWRDWKNRGIELTVDLEGYDRLHTTRFVVGDVQEVSQDARPGQYGGLDTDETALVNVRLIRVDHAGAYASAT